MEHGILSGKKIVEEIEAGLISISPFVRKNVNPVSVDLTLGRKVSVYKAVVSGDWNGEMAGKNIYQLNSCIDAKIENDVIEHELKDGEAIFLRPGIGYLMHTAERVWTESYVPILDGKSSIGRLFTQVHFTAGFGDPGFNGQYTLEVAVSHPVILYAGMRICQMRFHTICGEHISYQDTGSYKGELAEGPIPSQSYRMFQK
jgi:dCTP deaminase